MGFIISGIILVGLLGAVVFLYNGLVQKRALVENGWSDIDVQLKRRTDLIPRLVETVKAYASHERTLFQEVIAARQAALQSAQISGPKNQTVQNRAAAETALAQPTSRLLALAEAYPDIKSNKNFLELQIELSETEDKIEMARRFYNGAVRDLNISVQSVPSNLIAKPFGFRQAEFFNINPIERAVPQITLSDA